MVIPLMFPKVTPIFPAGILRVPQLRPAPGHPHPSKVHSLRDDRRLWSTRASAEPKEGTLRFQNLQPKENTTWMFGRNRGTPKWMVKIMENPIEMDDLGVPLFLETPTSTKNYLSLMLHSLLQLVLGT